MGGSTEAPGIHSGEVPTLAQNLGKSSLCPQQSKQPLWTGAVDSAPQPMEMHLHPALL